MQEISISDRRKPVAVYFDIELDDAGLTPDEFRVYSRMARRCAGSDGGRCFEAAASMAQGCRMARATLFKAIKGLLDRHFIVKQSTQGAITHYALTDKLTWLPVHEVNTSDTGTCSTAEHPPVQHVNTPVQEMNAPCSAREHMKKTKKKTIKEEKIKDISSASPSAQPAPVESLKEKPATKKKDKPPKSPHHSHPAAVSYREILGFRALNAEQASLIAFAVGVDVDVSPPDWLQFLREHASRGAKYSNNVPVIVAAFGRYRAGDLYQQAIEWAWNQEKGRTSGGKDNGINVNQKRNGKTTEDFGIRDCKIVI